MDLNNEYGGLAWNKDGTQSALHKQITILEPGGGLGFSLDYCGKAAISSMLKMPWICLQLRCENSAEFGTG